MSTKQSMFLTWLLCLTTFSSSVKSAPGAPPRQTTPAAVLQARDAVQTAGFISGNPNSPLTCPGTSSVVKGPEYAFGCCGASTCWKPATCHTSGQPSCGPNCVYSQITSCTDDAFPSCAEYILKTDADDPDPLTSFLCLPTSTQIVVLVAATTSVDASTGATPGATGASSTTTGSSPTDISVSTADIDGKSSSSSSGGGGGYTKDQKIELGIGIGLGLPAIIVGIVMPIWLYWLSRKPPAKPSLRSFLRSYFRIGRAAR